MEVVGGVGMSVSGALRVWANTSNSIWPSNSALIPVLETTTA